MVYKSSPTKPLILAIILILLFWIANVIAIINSNGVKDVIVFSSFMFVFIIFYISIFVKGIYIVVENNSVKYVHIFLLRKQVEIGKINKIQKSLIGGFYNSLSLIYEENGKVKDIKISTITFKKDVLKQFVSDLMIKNPRIIIDPSANELISR